MPKHLDPTSRNAYHTNTLFRLHLVEYKCFILYQITEH